MNKFRVSVNVVRCCDLYVDAASAEEAKRKALDGRHWRDADDSAWCDGHLGTEEVDECVPVDGNGNEI